MSIFGNIMSTILGHNVANPQATTTVNSTSVSNTARPTSDAAAPSATPKAQVDVEAVLTKLASQTKEKLDWRRSIVDLMKLLKLDSSLTARTELAKELHYTGNTNDSATMNVWLHKQIMAKLAENGGTVPKELMH